MSSISDELRQFIDNDVLFPNQIDELRCIADRIDAETVELPKSADGKIWTGREVGFWTGAADGDWHKFNGLAYIDDRWCVEDSDFERYPAVSVWHERPDRFAFAHRHAPTVEDVLQGMLEQAVGYSDAHTTVALNAIVECAAKLRLAGEDA